MATEILFPQWAMGLQDGVVTQWLKEVGDRVEEGDELVEIETSKVTSTAEAPTSGVLLRIDVPEGEVVQVQDVLCVIGTLDEAELYHETAADVTATEPTSPTPALRGSSRPNRRPRRPRLPSPWSECEQPLPVASSTAFSRWRRSR